jgi:archaeal flagellar protein FlaJ
MIYIENKIKHAVFGFSAVLGISLLIWVFVSGIYTPTLPYLIPLDQGINNYLTVAIIITILPVSLIEYNNNKWLKEVDQHLPRLLMDVTESMQSGLSLYNALENATKNDYGPITKELDSAMVDFRITSDFTASMQQLGANLKRPNAKRLTTILIEANETGGRIDDVLETSIELFTNLDEYRQERDAEIGPYILLVYVGAIIFLIISYTIIYQFLLPIIEVSQKEHVAGSGILKDLLEFSYYKSALYWASVIEGIAGGLVAGKIIYGRTKGGLIHSTILIGISFIFFNLLGV